MMESLGNKSHSSESLPFRIKEMCAKHAVALVQDIISIYKQGWMDTYPNETFGISKNDVQSRFENGNELTEEWVQLLQSPDRHTWVAFSRDEAVAGFCIARRGESENELEYIYLAPDSQGRGLGYALMKKALAWLGEDKPIVLFGASYNAHAIRFYEEFGFKLSEEKPPPKELSNGTRIPSMKMVKAPRS